MLSKIAIGSLIVAISLIQISCGGGVAANDPDSESRVGLGDNASSYINLEDTTFIYDNSPSLNAQTTITILDDGTARSAPGELVEWSVVEEPDGSNLSLTTSDNGLSVSFTPSVSGVYVLEAETKDGKSTRSTKFRVWEELAFDVTKIDGYDASVDVQQLQGVIKNQVWLYSTSLGRQQLEDIVSHYPGFTVVGYDDIEGLLLEFDDENYINYGVIEELKLVSGIDGLDYRVFEGNKVDRTLSSIAMECPDGKGLCPNDGADSRFDDGGANWHLEYIGMPEAWDITTGSKDISIGVIDMEFCASHEDMKGRFKSIVGKNFKGHGCAVSGIIGAETNNEIGVSGINWFSRIVTKSSVVPSFSYKNINKDQKVRVINNSNRISHWCGSVGGFVDPVELFCTRANKFESSFNAAISKYKKYIQSEDGKKKLHVWAAGNDGKEAKRNNGALHISGGKYLPLDNLIVVAAHLKDGRLVPDSNYGVTVDIAAPTGMKAPKGGVDGYYEAEDNNDYGGKIIDNRMTVLGGFTGTSAAAPVVTGVASLVFSVNPDFSPSDVKKILISSARNYVTERYVSEEYHGPNGEKTGTVSLEHPIPILDAAAALKLADEINKGKIAKITHSFPDPSKPEVEFRFGSANPDILAVGASITVSGTTNGTDWSEIESLSFVGDKTSFSVDPAYISYRVTGIATLEHLDSGVRISSKVDYEFSVYATTVNVRDVFSDGPLEGAGLRIEPIMDKTLPSTKGTTDHEGNASFYLLPGSYKIFVIAEGYKETTRILTVEPSGQSISISLPMTPSEYIQSTIVIRVTDSSTGQPIAAANVVSDIGENIVTASSSIKNGVYVVKVPSFVDYLILRVGSDGYVPSTIQISRSEIEQSPFLVKEVLLSKPDESLIVVEGGNLLYHLGNDVYSGTVNSQFQKRTSGISLELAFYIRDEQIAKFSKINLSMKIKGAQCDNRLYVNGNYIWRMGMNLSPSDGSYGDVNWTYDLSGTVFISGRNTLRIESAQCFLGGDYDDFEFTDILFRLEN